MLGDQVCDRNQVGLDHDKRSRSEECVPHHVTRDQPSDRDQEAIEIVVGVHVCDRDQANVGCTTRSVTRKKTAFG